MKNILIINAHQFYEGIAQGKLNKTLVDVAKKECALKNYAIQTSIIDNGYSVENEIKKHLWADIIITQSPVYWFGAPWIYKKYIDEVFTSALAQQILAINDGRTRKDIHKQYGTGGKMQGKKYMLSLTCNAPKEAFGNKEQYLFNGKTIDDIFIGITAVYKFCGAEILPSFSCFDVLKNPDIKNDITRFKKYINALL